MTALRRVALAFAAAALLLATLAPAYAVERILLFISDVDVQRNGDLLVRETILVQAEGREIRRGMLRDFPTTYTRRDGSRVEVGFSVQSVSRDGQPENFATERLANGVRVRIGSADRFISNGRHEYVIVYRTTRQIGFFPDVDELYWNATGNGWTFAIDVAEARITLPEQVPFRQSAYYTGPQGAQGKDAAVADVRPGRIVFRTTRPLPPRNGLTVAAAWEKGVVIEPSNAQLFGAWLRDNAHIAVAVLGTLGVLGYYLVAWLLVGRDPPRGTIIPLFAPPEKMSAAAVRYVRDMELDDRTFTAAIVDCAVRGHIKITEDDGERTLERRDNPAPLSPAEQGMVQTLFGTLTHRLRLTQSNHETISEAKGALGKGLEGSYQWRMFFANRLWASIGVLAVLTVLAAIVVVAFMTHGADDGGKVIFAMVFTVPAAVFLIIVLNRALPSPWGRSIFAVVFGALFTGAFAFAAFAMLAENALSIAAMIPAAVPLVLLPVASRAFYWMKAHTREGRRVTDQIEGFRQYLGVAEEGRLEAMHPPEKTVELFEKFLPYAIALDVENTWAAKFAGVLAAEAAAGAATATWYSGSSSFYDNPSGFADSVGGSLTQTISSASTAPGSTDSGGSSFGSSGGGSSGGGGGGGGGSGW